MSENSPCNFEDFWPELGERLDPQPSPFREAGARQQAIDAFGESCAGEPLPHQIQYIKCAAEWADLMVWRTDTGWLGSVFLNPEAKYTRSRAECEGGIWVGSHPSSDDLELVVGMAVGEIEFEISNLLDVPWVPEKLEGEASVENCLHCHSPFLSPSAAHGICGDCSRSMSRRPDLPRPISGRRFDDLSFLLPRAAQSQIKPKRKRT